MCGGLVCVGSKDTETGDAVGAREAVDGIGVGFAVGGGFTQLDSCEGRGGAYDVGYYHRELFACAV